MVVIMSHFEGPTGLTFNRGLIEDPMAFARESHAASWLVLCGDEFATMDGGLSYASVQAAVPESAEPLEGPADVDGDVLVASAALAPDR